MAVPAAAQEAAPAGEYVVKAIVQEVKGSKYNLRGSASIESAEMFLEADEIDYDSETGLAEARGHVHFLNKLRHEEMWAERVDYDLKRQQGTFYEVRGSAPGKIDPRPGILTTGNPFLFRGKWAERIQNRYILHQGEITNCTYPNPSWVLAAPKFDIIPGERALAYKAVLRVQKIPLLFAPVFYKDLSSQARRSGFLTPSIGNSSRRGQMAGLGYYWAINRSFDLQYRAQYFTLRGLAHTADFRGKPTRNSDFDFYIYGVDDKGIKQDDGTRRKEGGYIISATGVVDWGKGFQSRAFINYLSNFSFRQAFTESFNEAVFSEVNSMFYTTKNWSSFHFNGIFTEQENFQLDERNSKISIRKLPQIEFNSREREIRKSLPVWISWGSSFGLVRRTQGLFQTRQFVQRSDVEPRISTALRWREFHLSPYVSIRNTNYSSSFLNGMVTGQNLNRLTKEWGAEFTLPTLSRVYSAPRWMGKQVKHSIEPRASFRSLSGVSDFDRFIRYDEMELLVNTTELDVTVSNRLWAKDRNGQIFDFVNWEVSQRRFFDRDFGGALRPNFRNVFQSTTQMSAYTFLDQARGYSPVVSVLRGQPRPGFGFEWRTDYDPLRGKLVNTSFSADARLQNYFLSLGHNRIACVPLATPLNGVASPCEGTPQAGTVLSPPSNQIRGMVGIGQESKRGWNMGFMAIYDYRTSVMQFANTQITYNTNCCAYSVQYRRFAFGNRNENQFRAAFVIANIGSFGTLRRQERLF
jgi:LPS-assembly protein